MSSKEARQGEEKHNRKYYLEWLRQSPQVHEGTEVIFNLCNHLCQSVQDLLLCGPHRVTRVEQQAFLVVVCGKQSRECGAEGREKKVTRLCVCVCVCFGARKRSTEGGGKEQCKGPLPRGLDLQW